VNAEYLINEEIFMKPTARDRILQQTSINSRVAARITIKTAKQAAFSDELNSIIYVKHNACYVTQLSISRISLNFET